MRVSVGVCACVWDRTEKRDAQECHHDRMLINALMAEPAAHSGSGCGKGAACNYPSDLSVLGSQHNGKCGLFIRALRPIKQGKPVKFSGGENNGMSPMATSVRFDVFFLGGGG